MFSRRCQWVLWLLAVCFISACSDDKPADDTALLNVENTMGGDLSVSLVKPAGEEQIDVTQVIIIFNKKMVPLGDMEKSAQGLPVNIEPAPDCHWRWLNTTTLGCWLDKALPYSSEYSVTVGKGMRALDGAVLGQDYQSSFSTQTLKLVNNSVDFTGPVNPEITVAFNQPVNIESLKTAITLSCGSNEYGTISVEQIKPGQEEGRWDASRSYRIRTQENLAEGTGCSMVLSKGISVVEGPLLSKSDFKVSFQTYPEFFVKELGCYWKNKVSGDIDSIDLSLKDCNPDDSVWLNFSVPTSNKNFAGKLKIEPQAGWRKGGYSSPEYMLDNPDEEMSGYYLSSPFAGTTSYTVDLAADIKDKFGRPLKGARKLLFETGHFKASMRISKETAVIEKDGPYKLGYKAVNIKDFRLRLYADNSPRIFDYIRLNDNYSSRCSEDEFDPDNKFQAKDIVTNLDWDEARYLPIDFKELLPENTIGTILGRVDIINDMEDNRIDLSGGLIKKPLCPKRFNVQITDLGITSKLGYFNGGVWVHSLKTGNPVEGAVVKMVDGANEEKHKAVTDAQGFAEFPGLKTLDPERKMREWKQGKWFIVASTNDDISMIDLKGWSRGINGYDFNITSTKLTKRNNFLMQAITDRPLYKPGDNVRIKVFARQWDHESLKLLDPDEGELFVEVVDSRSNKVLEKTSVIMNPFSTGQLNFTLPKNAATGTYTIQVYNKLGYTLSKSDAFSIEEYRLPPFKINMSSAKDNYTIHEMVPLSGRAEYHFGGGVKNAKGTINASYTAEAYVPDKPELQQYSFGITESYTNWWDTNTGYDEVIRFYQDNITSDETGAFNTAIKLPKSRINKYGKLILEAGFSDDSGKTIANRMSVKVHPTDFYLGLKTSEWVYKPGEDLAMKVVAVSPEEKTLAGKKVKLTLMQRKYNTVRRRGTGNYFHYETVTEDKEVSKCEFITKRSASGCELKPASAGYYIVQAESKDASGRKVESSLSAYVTGSDYIGWWRQDHDRIDLIPEKSKYEIGDTMRVLVKSPYDKARAIITVERHGILHREERDLIGGAQVIEVPLNKESYAPGVYLSVVLIKGRTSDKIDGDIDLGKPSFKMGLIPVEVVNSATRLQVKSKTSKAEYKPGEEISASIKVTDINGKGLESEVAIAVVDEAILQLAGDYMKKYEVHDGFYQIPDYDVTTSETLVYLLGRRHFGKKGASAGGGGGKDGMKLRELFKAVAYWEPALMTDVNGNAEFKFKAPDNLTGWKIISVAVDRNHRFGNGGSSFKTNKELMLESVLPNFATEGDVFDARFVVHNRSKNKLDVNVNLKSAALDITGKADKKIVVNKSDKTIVDYPVKVGNAEEAIIEIRADGGVDKDGMRLTLPITKYLSLETFGTNGTTIQKQIKEALDIPKGIRTDVGGLEVLLSSSVLSHLDDTFKYVFDYPYTCWEQQLTKALMYRNNITLSSYLGDDVRIEKDTATKEVEATLANAALFQTSSGGFAYWKPQDRLTDPYLSAYTALGFSWLTESGYEVDEKVDKKLDGYLRSLLNKDWSWPWFYSERSKATIRSMVAYLHAKGGEDNSSVINKLYEERNLLSLFGKGFLLMAMHHTGESMKPQLEKLKQEILNHSEITSDKIQFREQADDGFSRILHSTTRSNCLLLTAFTETDPVSKQIVPLMRFVSTSRRANRWNNTQENLYCLNAMHDYTRVYERDMPNFTVNGAVGEHDLGETSFDSFQAKPKLFNYPFSEKDPGTKSELVLDKKGDGRLYYTARMKLAYQQVRKDTVNSGMTVIRQYYVKDGKTWQLVQGDANIKRGDLVRVQLKVSVPAERLFVALNDPLPAGLEPVNTALAAASTTDAASGESDDSAGSYTWNEDDYWMGAYKTGGFYHRELRLKSVQYFADFIAAGDYELNYVAQAIATGTFNANPTLVEEMYSPETYGKGAPATFIIKEPAVQEQK